MNGREQGTGYRKQLTVAPGRGSTVCLRNTGT